MDKKNLLKKWLLQDMEPIEELPIKRNHKYLKAKTKRILLKEIVDFKGGLQTKELSSIKLQVKPQKNKKILQPYHAMVITEEFQFLHKNYQAKSQSKFKAQLEGH